MDEEYHKKRVENVQGSADELVGMIARRLFDPHVRYLKIELSSEGTLYYEGKITKQF